MKRIHKREIELKAYVGRMIWGTGVHSFKAEEFEIVELLSRDYEVQELESY